MNMKQFETTFTVMPKHVDALNHVNNVVYVQWIQDIAATHWHNVAPKHMLSKAVWVVRKHEIDYLKPAFVKQHLTGITWVENMEGVSSTRIVHIRHGDTLLVSAQTNWIMLDAQTLRPKRFNKELIDLFL